MKNMIGLQTCLIAILLSGTHALGCEIVSLSQPANGAWAQAQPLLQWSAKEGITYRVQVSLQVPEQAIYYSNDVLVQGGLWQFPVAASAPLTAAKILISQNCPQFTTSDLAFRPPSFFVDLRQACEISVESLRIQDSLLTWTAKGDIASYSIRQYEGVAKQLRLLKEHQSQLASFSVASLACEPGKSQVISVQPVCNTLKARAVAYSLCP